MRLTKHYKKHSRKHSSKKYRMKGGALTQEDKNNIRLAFYTALSAIAVGASASVAISTMPNLSAEIKNTVVLFAQLMYQIFYNVTVAGVSDITTISRSFLESSIKYVSDIYAACPQGVTFAAGVALSGPLASVARNVGDTASSMMNFNPNQPNVEFLQGLFGNGLEGLTQLLFIICENIVATPSMIASSVSSMASKVANSISSLMNMSCRSANQDVANLNEDINVLATDPDNEAADERIRDYFTNYQRQLEDFQARVNTPEFQELLSNVKSMSRRGDQMYTQPDEYVYDDQEPDRKRARSSSFGGKRKTHKRKHSKRKERKSRKSRKSKKTRKH